MHVLMIDDSLLAALDVVDSLSVFPSCTTSLASTAEHALRAVANHKPDLIIAEVLLEGGSGPAVVGRIRATLGDVPVIYLANVPDRASAEHPGTDILAKPLERDALIEW